MVKKRYIKRMYIEVAYCDKCGAELRPTGVSYCTYPSQDEYICTNKECSKKYTFLGNNLPGTIKYEFEEEEDV